MQENISELLVGRLAHKPPNKFRITFLFFMLGYIVWVWATAVPTSRRLQLILRQLVSAPHKGQNKPPIQLFRDVETPSPTIQPESSAVLSDNRKGCPYCPYCVSRLSTGYFFGVLLMGGVTISISSFFFSSTCFLSTGFSGDSSCCSCK